MSLQIGSLRFERPLMMAPMEGITDIPFRKIVRKNGCGVICTQMIHAEGLLRGNHRRMEEVIAMDRDEKPIGFQLCGSDPKIVGEAAKMAQDLGADFIDLNMGCPAPNVVKLGAGAALLKEPERAGEVVRAVVANIQVPVTVKIRAGWDDQYRTAIEVARIVEQEGAALVAVHARTKAQRFRGKADWSLIQEVKNAVKIPVAGNGDIFHPDDVSEMMKATGADAVMIARGALGNPWLFSERTPTVGEISQTVLDHFDLHLSFYKNPRAALMTFRKHIVWYTKGLRNSAEFRKKVFEFDTRDVVLAMMREFFDQFDPQSLPDAPHVH